MSFELTLAALLGIGLMIYLLFALLQPERLN